MEIEIEELQWDVFNTGHIKKHAVTIVEIEEACRKIIYVDITYGRRYLLVGRTDVGRLISIVLTQKRKNAYYVVTARDSSRGERKKAKYVEEK